MHFSRISLTVYIYCFNFVFLPFPGKQETNENHFPRKTRYKKWNWKPISELRSLIISLFMCLCYSRLAFRFQFSLLFSGLYCSHVWSFPYKDFKVKWGWNRVCVRGFNFSRILFYFSVSLLTRRIDVSWKVARNSDILSDSDYVCSIDFMYGFM